MKALIWFVCVFISSLFITLINTASGERSPVITLIFSLIALVTAKSLCRLVDKKRKANDKADNEDGKE